MNIRMRKLNAILLLTTFLSFFSISIHAQAYMSKAWGKIDYQGEAWVKNTSRPFHVTNGLDGRHLSIWASHGMYYDVWKWQRPNLFCTTEDLFTQTIVVPYLMPMLEKAGAYVFTPRERDWQKNEVIVDNDISNPSSYQENSGRSKWVNTPKRGFSMHTGHYFDGENPFTSGRARMTKATKKKQDSSISFIPNIPEAGRYAVYVSYQTLDESIPDAQYIVFHKGEITTFKVNQQMGGGTWVYLGTFEFDKGQSDFNKVVLTNYSKKKGVVTADAVRFGGGMGNIERGGMLSGMPRTLEGARYYAQWAGIPYSIYGMKGGTNDYADDINTRPLMTNYISGGSVFNPTKEGLKVPIELSLAVHSDAGVDKYGHSLVGSLSICTTDFNDGRLGSGISRMTSKDFASILLDDEEHNMTSIYGEWMRRYLWDRNYAETRLPEMPSAILETLSHQNFPDMIYGQDPNFRFHLARSIYKSILRYVNDQHGVHYVVQPLPPISFSVEFIAGNKVKLSWKAQEDKLEKSARPTAFCLYTAQNDGAFDNGKIVKENSIIIKLTPGMRYRFYVTAINNGGESFPSETLAAYHNDNDAKRILIVNGFQRLSSPAIIDNDTLQGFDLDSDIGVSYGLTAGWVGRQLCFDKKKIGIVSSNGLGYSGDELAGHFIMGNTFDYPACHAKAMSQCGNYQISSCSVDAIISGQVNMRDYDCVDLILGLQRAAGLTPAKYKTFPVALQSLLADYLRHGGALFVSGSHIGSDMTQPADAEFLANMLKVAYTPSPQTDNPSTVSGLGMTFGVYAQPNHLHYSINHPDALSPTEPAICAMQYDDGRSAAVAYSGSDHKTFVMAFPFECIVEEQDRKQIMGGILNYLIP